MQNVEGVRYAQRKRKHATHRVNERRRCAANVAGSLALPRTAALIRSPELSDAGNKQMQELATPSFSSSLFLYISLNPKTRASGTNSMWHASLVRQISRAGAGRYQSR